MIFLKKEDFLGQIKKHTLNRILNDDDTILDTLELATIDEMQSYLSIRYDSSKIFEAVDNDRHALVVMYAVDILLYHLYSRLDPSQIPDIRILRYENAIKWLEMVAKGRLSPNLPVGEVGDGKNKYNKFYIGSEKRRPE